MPSGLSKNCTLLVGVLVFISLLAESLFAQAPANLPSAAASRRPRNVPEEYVVTPFGYFHPSCVLGLARGDSQLPDGRVQHANGSVETSVPVCNYPRYARDGSAAGAGRITTPQASAPVVNGWVESASITTSSTSQSYGGLTSLWRVPPQPAAQDGQVLFLFPGLEDIFNTQSILQPVLQWADGQWAVANWNCCLANIVVRSPLVNVKPGDQIFGSITSDCDPGTSFCATWNVFSIDLHSGQSTTLSHTPSAGQSFNWAFGGVLEPYFLSSCDDYPRNQKITFHTVVFDESLNPVADPPWVEAFNSTVTPQCNYGVNAIRNRITLSY